MKYLILVFLLSSCATVDRLYEQVKTKPQAEPVDPYEQLKISSDTELIGPRLMSKENIEKFRKVLCKESSKKDCDKQFLEMINARLGEKYKYADWKSIEQHCKAYPIECENIEYFEKLSIDSHNRGVEDLRARNIASEEAESNRKSAIFWQSLGQGMQQMEQNRLRQQEINKQNQPVYIRPTQTNCTRYGNRTTCQSY